jgi:hypothetical protein
MKPQPPAISQIILARMRTRIRRVARAEQLEEDMKDLRREAAFEDDIARVAGGRFFERVYSGEAQSEWCMFLLTLPLSFTFTDALLTRQCALCEQRAQN